MPTENGIPHTSVSIAVAPKRNSQASFPPSTGAKAEMKLDRFSYGVCGADSISCEGLFRPESVPAPPCCFCRAAVEDVFVRVGNGVSSVRILGWMCGDDGSAREGEPGGVEVCRRSAWRGGSSASSTVSAMILVVQFYNPMEEQI